MPPLMAPSCSVQACASDESLLSSMQACASVYTRRADFSCSSSYIFDLEKI